jgi:hypothetical protein
MQGARAVYGAEPFRELSLRGMFGLTLDLGFGLPVARLRLFFIRLRVRPCLERLPERGLVPFFELLLADIVFRTGAAETGAGGAPVGSGCSAVCGGAGCVPGATSAFGSLADFSGPVAASRSEVS